MTRLMKNTLLLVMLAVPLAGCNAPGPTVMPAANTNASAPSGSGSGGAPPVMPAPTSNVPGDLTFKVPAGWTSEQPTSTMRYAQYKVPGDGGDASLVIYYFGQGQGGSIEDNFNRWVGQMQKSRDQAKTDKLMVSGMNVTLLDVTGTYAGDMMGGNNTPQPNSRMRAGVIETPKGGYFIKFVGPEKTVGRWDDAFMSFVKSAEFKK